MMDTDPKDHKIITIPGKAKLIATAFMLLISTSAGFVGGYLGAKSQRQVSNDASASQQVITNESQLISGVAKDVGESVVSVNVTSEQVTGGFFGPARTYEAASAGTGFILNEEGVIVTNRHVIPEGTTEVSVTMSDGSELEDVEVIGRTSSSDSLDIAFLRVKDKKGKDLKPARLGDSSKVIVGEKVIAIGNALGQFQNTVTEGIISGYGRSVIAGDESGAESLQNLFQTDAAINQGNSGGPLVNINGEVIGINTAVAGEGAENIGFAIPIDDVKGLIETVLSTGKLERPYLGVRYVSLTDDIAEDYELEVKRGAYILPSEGGQPSIFPGSPAAKAGLREGDVITTVNDRSIDEKNNLTSVLSRFKVGEEVTLEIIRDGQEAEIRATLEALTD
jgi:serine protease Do